MAVDLAPTPAPPYRAPARWGLRLFLLALVLGVLVWALPILAARSSLLGWATERAGARFGGQVRVGSASLGWLSPVLLRDVEIRDAAGRPVARAARVESDRWLLSLLLQPDRPGTVRFDRLMVEVTVAGRQSNVEEILAAVLPAPVPTAPADAAGPLPLVRVEVTDGTVKVTDAEAKRTCEVQALKLALDLAPDALRAARVTVQGTTNDTVTLGHFKFEGGAQDWDGPTFRADVKGRFAGFPLWLANLAVRRVQPGTELSGYLEGQCNVSAARRDGDLQVQFVGEVVGRQCELAAPYLEERVVMQEVKVPCKAQWQGGTLRVEQGEVLCDVGRAAVQGRFDPGQDLLTNLRQPGVALALDLDAAKVAERLPKTLRLHPDLRITGGQLRAECKSVAGPAGVAWEGRLVTTDLRGVKRAQPIAWPEPMTVQFRVRDADGGLPVFDQLHCAARFLRVEGASSADHFAVSAEADLHKLAEPLGQFVDLGNLRLAGQAHARLTVRRLDGDRFAVDGGAQLKHINLAWLTDRPWQEDTVTMQVAGRGTTVDGRHRLESGSAALHCGSDFVTARLLEPATDLRAGPWGLVQVQLDGDLGRWQAWAGAWTTLLDGWQFGGFAKVQARVRPAREATEVTALAVGVREAKCEGAGLWVHEPALDLRAAGRWADGTLTLTDVVVRCPAATLESARLSVRTGPLAVAGTASVRGDLARLRGWMQDPREKPGDPVAGTLAGQVDLQPVGHQQGLSCNLTVRDLTWGPPASPLVWEPTVKLTGRGSYDGAGDSLHLGRLRVETRYFTCYAQGRLAALGGRQEVDLTGTLSYDLARLEPLLRPYLADDAEIIGEEVRAFKLSGPLYPEGARSAGLQLTELKGEARAGWTAMYLFGSAVGPLDARVCLQRGWLQLYPAETTLNGGRLRLQPNLRLVPGPVELVLLAGPVIQNAQLTGEMCASALGYAVPILAKAAEVDGAVSLTLEGGRIPMGAPATGEVKGTFVLHETSVAPGPLVRELGQLLRKPGPVSLVKECRVPFHLVQGRVYHRDLELRFPDLTIRTSGSVGLDGSLALVAEMPVPPKWTGNGRLSAAFAKQTIRLPIGGTLEHPRIDPAALRAVSAQFVRSAAGDVIRRELDGKLQRLLRPNGDGEPERGDEAR